MFTKVNPVRLGFRIANNYVYLSAVISLDVMYHGQSPEHLYLFFACNNKKIFLAIFADGP
jgi:hypothetical protein